MDTSFAVRLKAAREKSTMTQQELADRLNVGREAVARWETGARTPSIDTAAEIAKALGLSLDKLGGLKA